MHLNNPLARPLWRVVFAATLVASVPRAHSAEPLPTVDPRALAPVVDGGLTPERVADAVRATAPSVALADNALRAAEAQVALARVAAVPRVDLGASYTRLSPIEQPPFSFGGQSIESPFPVILDQYALTASLSVPLSDIFLRALPGLDIVRRSADARAQEARAQAIVAGWQGREAYHGWLRAVTARNVAAASVETLRATLRNVESLADAGVLPRVDVISTRAGVEGAQTALRQAEHGVVLAEDAIRILTGWEDSTAFVPGEDLLSTPAVPAPTAEMLVERALESRPEVTLFAELLSISASRLRIQRTGGWPSLHVGAGVLYANPNPRIVPSEQQFDATWDVGVSIAWSPNDLWRARTQVDEASIQRDRVREELRAFELGLRTEAAQAASAWSRALTAIDGARVQLDAATEEFQARVAALEGGVGTTTELLSAQGRLVSAWLDLLDGAIELRRAMSLAARITGEDTPVHATPGTPVSPLWPSAAAGQQ